MNGTGVTHALLIAVVLLLNRSPPGHSVSDLRLAKAGPPGGVVSPLDTYFAGADSCSSNPAIRYETPDGVPVWGLGCTGSCTEREDSCKARSNGMVAWCQCPGGPPRMPTCCSTGILADMSGPVPVGGCVRSCPQESGSCIMLPGAQSAGCVTGPP